MRIRLFFQIGAAQLFRWYSENGIENIGFESEESETGPVGQFELLTIASHIGARLQNEGFLAEKFGKPIPILVHGLEYAAYDIEATENANPHGEADVFLEAMG